jgi:hypothetical protein
MALATKNERPSLPAPGVYVDRRWQTIGMLWRCAEDGGVPPARPYYSLLLLYTFVDLSQPHGGANRVNKLVARYSELSKGTLTSPFDEVMVTTTPSRGHSPERAAIIPPAVEEPEEGDSARDRFQFQFEMLS